MLDHLLSKAMTPWSARRRVHRRVRWAADPARPAPPFTQSERGDLRRNPVASFWRILTSRQRIAKRSITAPFARALSWKGECGRLRQSKKGGPSIGKLFVLTDPEAHFLQETADFEELCRLHLEPGPYLVQAKGLLSGPGALAALRLDVQSVFGSVVASQESLFVAHASQTFLLIAAASIPFEGGAGSTGTPVPPGPAASLSVRPTGPSLTPGHHVAISDITITALAVDEIVAAA
jgi:hypothetical protein